MPNQIMISSIDEISAIYYALLQCGYEFCSLNREPNHVNTLQQFSAHEALPDFFFSVKQETCAVYPYWPRACLLESAVWHLSAEHTDFHDFDAYKRRVMSQSNLSAHERNDDFWTWMTGFPAALTQVLQSPGFHRYQEWESVWIAEQNDLHEDSLRQMTDVLDQCIKHYDSPVRAIRIVLNPIKCVYSSDYHLADDCFVFCSGAFRVDSVIHELLHMVVHPVISGFRNVLQSAPRAFPGIDASYYLSGNIEGQLNAFEEYAVRHLTREITNGHFPSDLLHYLKSI